jgi:hypothetical protein
MFLIEAAMLVKAVEKAFPMSLLLGNAGRPEGLHIQATFPYKASQV